MSTIHASAADHSAMFTDKQRKIALTIVALAFVMDLLDSTIVNVAIPTIQQNLGASYSAIQWLLAGYSLTFALLLITGGRMGDVFGYRKLFMIGVAGFTVASLLCGLAQNPGMLIAARLLQGGMAALMVPQVLSLMQVMYKPEERGAINGPFGALGGVAASLGPVIGGLLIKANVGGLDWRPLFLLNVPVGIFALVMAPKYLPSGKSDHPLKLDLTGTGIILVALLLLVFPLIQGRELGWPAWTFIMMMSSIPFLALFVYWVRRKDRLDGSALVVPSLFKRRSFTAGLFINLIFEAAMLSFFLTITLILQIGLGFTPIHAALTGLATAVGISLTMALLGEKVIPKLGRTALIIGTVAMATGLIITNAVLAHYGRDLHSWQLAPGLVIVGIGMGFTFASLFAVVLNGVDVKHAGSASGLLNAVQQVGGAIGIALIGVIFFGHVSSGAASNFDKIKPQLTQQLSALQLPAPAVSQIVASARTCYVDRAQQKDMSETPKSCQTDSSQPGSDKIGKVIEANVLKANDAAFNNAFKYGVIFEVSILAVVAALSFVLPRKIKAPTTL